jgi:hypothetical protein
MWGIRVRGLIAVLAAMAAAAGVALGQAQQGVPTWRKYALVKIANGVNGCANADGCWQVNGVLGPNAAAGLTQAVPLFTAPARAYVTAASLKLAVRCTGAATATTGLGTASAVGLYVAAAAYNIDTVVAATNTYNALATAGRATDAAETVNADLVTTVNNIDQLVAGCAVDYWIYWGVLP